MIINDTIFDADCYDIIEELQRQCHLNGINILNKIDNSPNNVQICCPYHNSGQERRPSAGVKKSDGTFHCFACNEVHSLPEVISFCLGNTNDITGIFGWSWLLKNFLTISVENRKPIELDISRKKADNKNAIYVTEEELDKYREYHPYMWKRKLTPSVVDMFDIGYDKDTNCITFPVRDTNGNTLFVARRSVVTKFFNYPSGAEKPLYGLYEAYRYTNCQECIICESMLDALACWSYGSIAVALNGLGNELQFEQLRNARFRKYILATDNDSAGLNARNRIRDNVSNKLISEFVWNYPGVKDINDMTREQFENLQEKVF